uniref:VP1 n=1 Tax=Recovirus Bangladesh/289/2007 TaxID=1203029 RepID=I6UGN8_9CALI|nr:VP1 [Recovirus Bangladesh/289/2007]
MSSQKENLSNKMEEVVQPATGGVGEVITGAAAPLPENPRGLELAPTINPIDPWILANFTEVPGGAFTINHNSQPGHILFESQISPDLNMYLAHLWKMYAGWSGGFELKIVLAGNAFSSGKIIVGVVPPNVLSPRTPYELTGYPHVILDLRTADSFTFTAPDIKNTSYHFRGDQLGRVIAMIYSPLRSTATAPFDIECRMLSRPLLDFKFTMITPPIQESVEPTLALTPLPASSMTNPRAPNAPIDSLVVDTAFTTSRFMLGRYTATGGSLMPSTLAPASRWAFAAKCLAKSSDNTYVTYEVVTPTNPDHVGGVCPVPRGFCDWGLAKQINTTTDKKGWLCLIAGPYDDTTDPNHPHFDNAAMVFVQPFWDTINRVYSYKIRALTASFYSVGKIFQFFPMGLVGTNSLEANTPPTPNGDWDSPPPITCPNGEAFVFFSSKLQAYKFTTWTDLESYPADSVDIYSLMTPELITQTLGFPWPTGKVMLIDYSMYGGNQVQQMKLYPEGYLTTAVKNSVKQILPGSGTFKFNSWVSRNYSIAGAIIGTETVSTE